MLHIVTAGMKLKKKTLITKNRKIFFSLPGNGMSVIDVLFALIVTMTGVADLKIYISHYFF